MSEQNNPNVPPIAETPEQRVADIQPVVQDMVDVMRREITAGATAAGLSEKQAQGVVNRAEPAFFDLLVQGAPPPGALMEAVAYGDRMVSAEILQQTIDGGASPQDAFQRIKALKLALPAEEGAVPSADLADTAQTAFDSALSGGKTPEEALYCAFDAAARLANGLEAA